MRLLTSCFLTRIGLPFIAGLALALTATSARAADPATTATIDLTFTSIERIERYVDTIDTSDKKHLIYVGGTLDSGDTAWVTFTACSSCSNYQTLMDECLRSGKLAKILGDQGLHVYATTSGASGTLVDLKADSDGDGTYNKTYTITVADTDNEGFISCGLVDP